MTQLIATALNLNMNGRYSMTMRVEILSSRGLSARRRNIENRGESAEAALKNKTPRHRRGATFYKSECITALLIVNKNLHFLQRFFYFCLFNHLHDAGGPYAGPNTRIGPADLVIWHNADHYGQMLLYLRLNGIVPPR